LTLKLDIEGAEYVVLRKMIKDKTIKMVKSLYVEFHGDRFSVSTEDHNSLLKELKRNGIVPKKWISILKEMRSYDK
jgi:hypothetical protein